MALTTYLTNVWLMRRQSSRVPVMKRRSFLKGVLIAAALVAVPLKLTEFGDSSIADLNAALLANRPISVLQRTLRATTYSLKDIKMWKATPKLPNDFNTIEEYNIVFRRPSPQRWWRKFLRLDALEAKQ